MLDKEVQQVRMDKQAQVRMDKQAHSGSQFHLDKEDYLDKEIPLDKQVHLTRRTPVHLKEDIGYENQQEYKSSPQTTSHVDKEYKSSPQTTSHVDKEYKSSPQTTSHVDKKGEGVEHSGLTYKKAVQPKLPNGGTDGDGANKLQELLYKDYKHVIPTSDKPTATLSKRRRPSKPINDPSTIHRPDHTEALTNVLNPVSDTRSAGKRPATKIQAPFGTDLDEPVVVKKPVLSESLKRKVHICQYLVNH